jgi:hypothetical protein
MFNNYAIVQGVDHIIPVDMYVPGCPPRPELLMDGILKLHDKIRNEQLVERPRKGESMEDFHRTAPAGSTGHGRPVESEAHDRPGTAPDHAEGGRRRRPVGQGRRGAPAAGAAGPLQARSSWALPTPTMSDQATDAQAHSPTSCPRSSSPTPSGRCATTCRAFPRLTATGFRGELTIAGPPRRPRRRPGVLPDRPRPVLRAAGRPVRRCTGPAGSSSATRPRPPAGPPTPRSSDDGRSRSTTSCGRSGTTTGCACAPRCPTPTRCCPARPASTPRPTSWSGRSTTSWA